MSSGPGISPDPSTGTPPAGLSFTIAIPQFAHRFKVAIGSDVLPVEQSVCVVLLSELDGLSGWPSVNTHVVASWIIESDNCGQWIEIPNGAYFAAIINLGEDDITPSIIYELSF